MKADRTLALAGMFQSAALVRALAEGREADAEALETSLDSIFRIDADSVGDVYAGGGGLGLGLSTLIAQLEQPRQDLECSRLVLAMMQLERKLARRHDLDEALVAGIVRIQRQREHFGTDHASIPTRLGELYEETLSTLRPRVMVHGNPDVLAQPAQAARIRATLLAGVRSAVLWRQLGGRQWQLLLQRRHHVMLARGLLSRTRLDRGS